MRVLGADDRQVVRNHRETHVPVLPVQRHVADVRVCAHQPRIETLNQVHQAGAVRAEIGAAVDLVAGLHSRLFAEPRKAFQSATSSTDRIPVVVAR